MTPLLFYRGLVSSVQSWNPEPGKKKKKKGVLEVPPASCFSEVHVKIRAQGSEEISSLLASSSPAFHPSRGPQKRSPRRDKGTPHVITSSSDLDCLVLKGTRARGNPTPAPGVSSIVHHHTKAPAELEDTTCSTQSDDTLCTTAASQISQSEYTKHRIQSTTLATAHLPNPVIVRWSPPEVLSGLPEVLSDLAPQLVLRSSAGMLPPKETVARATAPSEDDLRTVVVPEQRYVLADVPVSAGRDENTLKDLMTRRRSNPIASTPRPAGASPHETKAGRTEGAPARARLTTKERAATHARPPGRPPEPPSSPPSDSGGLTSGNERASKQ
ncbi:unnamed protein product [Lota lota]